MRVRMLSSGYISASDMTPDRAPESPWIAADGTIASRLAIVTCNDWVIYTCICLKILNTGITSGSCEDEGSDFVEVGERGSTVSTYPEYLHAAPQLRIPRWNS